MYNNAQRQEIYKVYVSDALRIIAENTAKFVGGSYIKKRYVEIIDIEPQKEKYKHDNKSAQDIITNVLKQTGIKVVKPNGSV